MEHKTDINMYKGLASYILPDGVLDYFDVVDFAEEPTPGKRIRDASIYTSKKIGSPDKVRGRA